MSHASTRIWLAIWSTVTLFWFVLTYRFHPTIPLAVIVTLSLMTAYGLAILVDGLYLRRWYAEHKRRLRYAVQLGTCMIIATATALVIIRICYFATVGPDPDPWGFPKHFGIDLFGLLVHWFGAQTVRPWVNSSRI